MDPLHRKIWRLVAARARACVREGVCDANSDYTCETFLNTDDTPTPCLSALREVLEYTELMEEAGIASIFDLQALLLEG